MFAQAGGDLAQLGARAGLGDAQDAAPGDHRGAHEGLVLRARVFNCRVEGLLVHRFALAGHNRFIQGQFGRLQQLAVGGHFFSGVQQHQVARHQFPHFHFHALPVAEDGGGGFEQPFERHVSALGLVFLHKAQDDINDYHHHDDGKVAKFGQQQGDGGRGQDDIDQRAFQLVEQDGPGGDAFFGGQAVFAKLRPPLQHFLGA